MYREAEAMKNSFHFFLGGGMKQDEKGALTPKSFANIVRLNLNISLFKINSCLKINLFQTEEWDERLKTQH